MQKLPSLLVFNIVVNVFNALMHKVMPIGLCEGIEVGYDGPIISHL